MARPAKAVNTMSKNLTKDEKAGRLNAEKKLKGGADKLKPPAYLSASQKKIFRNIVLELKAAEILGNLDIYILAQCSVAIDRLQEIEGMINDNLELLSDTKFMGSKDKYAKDFFRCCNELSLSPQSRAKIAGRSLQAQQEEDDVLMRVLKGGQAV